MPTNFFALPPTNVYAFEQPASAVFPPVRQPLRRYAPTSAKSAKSVVGCQQRRLLCVLAHYPAVLRRRLALPVASVASASSSWTVLRLLQIEDTVCQHLFCSVVTFTLGVEVYVTCLLCTLLILCVYVYYLYTAVCVIPLCVLQTNRLTQDAQAQPPQSERQERQSHE